MIRCSRTRSGISQSKKDKGLRFPQITYSKDWTGKDKELSALKLHELVRSIPIVRKAKSAHRDQGVM